MTIGYGRGELNSLALWSVHRRLDSSAHLWKSQVPVISSRAWRRGKCMHRAGEKDAATLLTIFPQIMFYWELVFIQASQIFSGKLTWFVILLTQWRYIRELACSQNLENKKIFILYKNIQSYFGDRDRQTETVTERIHMVDTTACANLTVKEAGDHWEKRHSVSPTTVSLWIWSFTPYDTSQ